MVSFFVSIWSHVIISPVCSVSPKVHRVNIPKLTACVRRNYPECHNKCRTFGHWDTAPNSAGGVYSTPH